MTDFDKGFGENEFKITQVLRNEWHVIYLCTENSSYSRKIWLLRHFENLLTGRYNQPLIGH